MKNLRHVEVGRLVSREEIRWLWLSILNREPESEAVYEIFSKHSSFASLRNDVLRSYEFFMIMKDRLSDFKATYKACDYPLTPVTFVPMRPTLGIACIMKNEMHCIGRMLQSCMPIANTFAIVDTGSTDKSVDVVRSCVPENKLLFGQEKFEDFAQARNAALNLIADKTDWTLFLDADEYLVPEDYNRLLNLLTVDPCIDGWRLPRYTFVDIERLEPPYYYPDYQQRLLRNRSYIRYHGRVHEQVSGVQQWGWAPLSEIAHGGSCGGPHIHHTALIDMTREVEIRKADLYRSLAGA